MLCVCASLTQYTIYVYVCVHVTVYLIYTVYVHAVEQMLMYMYLGTLYICLERGHEHKFYIIHAP